MRTIEVNGIKLEIDERTARTVESYKVGDRVKVLVKKYSDYAIYPGVIVGFAAFEKLPTIEVMYLVPESWESDPLKFVGINSKTEEIEIVPLNDAEVVLDRKDALERFDRSIRDARTKLEDLERKRAFFVEKFATVFEAAAEAEEDEE